MERTGKKRFFVKAAPAPEPAGPKRKASSDEVLAAQGLRRLTFVVPLDLWDRFIAMRCQGVKPNDVFQSWLREQTGGARESPGPA